MERLRDREQGLPPVYDGQFKRAIQDYDEAICLNPQYAEAYFNRGIAYRHLGQPFKRSIQDYDEAIRLNPQYAATYIKRGIGYISFDQYQRGIQDLVEANRLNADAYITLLFLQESIHDLEKVLGEMPQDSDVDIFPNSGDILRAIQDFDEVIRLNPQDADAYAGRAVANALLHKDAETNRDVDRAVELGFPRNVLDSIIDRLKSER